MNINRENPDLIMPVSKNTMMQRPHTTHASHRNTLGDIGNKVSAITIDGSKKAPVKKEIVQLTSKQQKVLTKNKATSSLKSLAETNNVEVVVKQVSVTSLKYLDIFFQGYRLTFFQAGPLK